MNTYNVIWLDQLGINDIDSVGGKNASLGEMIQNLGNLGGECTRRVCDNR